jgi:primosomal protein N' (replication factor Y)
MIAKGHDLPDVTFVGIVDCDVGLHMPDFRAAERSFQLLTQVAGRAGRRDKRGTVVLQTRVPSHASLKSTVAADYQSFAEGELQLRRALDYPPFMRLLRIIIAAEDKAVAQQWAQHVAEVTVSACDGRGISLLGPAPAPLEKVRSHWRYHILCKAPSASLLQNVMQRVKSSLPDQKKARLIFDLDPQDML